MWLSFGLRGLGVVWRAGEAQEGLASIGSWSGWIRPHRLSVTIGVMAGDETVLGGGRFATTAEGHWAMRACAGRWADRVRAIEGCAGTGGHVAARLLGEGEPVVDVPPKLSARVRVFATEQGRKTDATDAHSVALVGTRMAGLRPVVDDTRSAVLRVLVDRRRSLGEDHTRMVARLHHLLQLIPGGAKKDLSAAQAKVLLASVRPRDAAGKARRRVAAELIADLQRVHQRKKAANRELEALLAETGASLLGLNGIGPSGPARLLVEDQVRHRLSRGGNRQINRVLHIMATV